MKKFSKLGNTKKFTKDQDDVLYDNEIFKIINFEDWSVIKDTDIVVCIIYLIESNQIILRQEYIPSYKYNDGMEKHLTLVCGSIEEGETNDNAIRREVLEESGIKIKDSYRLEPLDSLYIMKSCCNKVYPYIISLNNNEFDEVAAIGDGSKAESMSKCVKVDVRYINGLRPSDLITSYMLLKLKEYLNLIS